MQDAIQTVIDGQTDAAKFLREYAGLEDSAPPTKLAKLIPLIVAFRLWACEKMREDGPGLLDSLIDAYAPKSSADDKYDVLAAYAELIAVGIQDVVNLEHAMMQQANAAQARLKQGLIKGA